MSSSEQESLNAILGSFDPRAFFTWFPGSITDYSTAASATSSDEELLRNGTSVHEYVHFLQSIGTSYGFSIRGHWWNRLLKTYQTYVTLCKFHFAKNEKVPFPITEYSRSPIREIREVARILLSYPGAEVEKARYLPLDLTTRLADLKIVELSDSQIPACPTIRVKGTEKPLCGLYLMESHARMIEESYLRLITQDSERTRRICEKLSNDDRYKVAFWAFMAFMPKERAIEFFFILDLALNTEVNPVPKSNEEYILSHPGHRYLALLQSASRVGSLDVTAHHFASEVRRYQEELISAAGLRSTLERNQEELHEMEEVTKKDVDERGFASETDFLRVKALKARQQFPWIFAHPALNLESWTWLKSNFACPYYFTEHGLAIDDRYKNEFPPRYFESKFVELDIISFASQVLGYRTSKCSKGLMECGLSYFRVKQLCPYANECPGLFDPLTGFPFPVVIPADPQTEIEGCPFGIFLTTRGFDLRSLDLDTGRDQVTQRHYR